MLFCRYLAARNVQGTARTLMSSLLTLRDDSCQSIGWLCLAACILLICLSCKQLHYSKRLSDSFQLFDLLVCDISSEQLFYGRA